MLPDVVVDDKALKAALEIMVQPVLLVADGKGVNLSQRLFFAQGMKQTTKGDSSATLTLKEYYDVAILFAQSIPHPKTVAIKLFYTPSDKTPDTVGYACRSTTPLLVPPRTHLCALKSNSKLV